MPAPFLPTRRHVLLVLDGDASDLVMALRRRYRTADVLPCRSVDEALVRLGSGRRYSAVLARAGNPEVDTNLTAAANRASTPMIVVGERQDLGRVVSAATGPVRLIDRPPGAPWSGHPDAGRRGWLVAVCGTAGAGTSTVAAGLAAGLASCGGVGADVLLADLALRADQAVLHGLGRPAVSLLDLIRAFRQRREPMTGPQLRAHTVHVGRGAGSYRLLPGLRRPNHWTAVGPAAFDPALSTLCSCFDLVVADMTAELEGDALVGSPDVEERNHMARRVVTWADMVIVVGRPRPCGRRRLADTVHDVLDLGVDPAAIQPVVNRCVRRLEEDERLPGLPAPVITLPDRRLDDLDAAGPVPARLAEPVRAVVVRHILRQPSARAAAHAAAPARVARGSLGTWTGDDAA